MSQIGNTRLKSTLLTALRWIGIVVFAYYQLPALIDAAQVLARPAFANLLHDSAELPYDGKIAEAFRHFPQAETEYYFGDFDDKDLFENHPLVDLMFPRVKNSRARCGFRKWSPTIRRDEKVLYSGGPVAGGVYVVCRH
ncbi:MAG: hypothetical protein JST80_01300 [Bdellovibrionales bacterium]|nr:hypothetical protein [Bdellovibrionales bacterium]